MAEILDSFSHWGIIRVYQSARGMLSSPGYRSFDKMDGGAKTGMHTFLKGQRQSPFNPKSGLDRSEQLV